MALIKVEHLVKEYKIIKKEKGLAGAFKGLIRPVKSTLRAVDDISFSIDKGEIVGYIGPNGAGKSTTIKMMSGILQPTSGSIAIAGLSPQKNRRQVVQNLGVVFGQRTQLYWDLRLGESFELLKRIYQIEDSLFRENLRLMNDILHLQELMNTPVRQLSLGQRMRGDLAAAMLHSPPILFLDEPTIGLDVEVKYAVRAFIKQINEQMQTTIILTTHDLDDIEQLSNRIMVINHGKLVENGSLRQLTDRVAPFRKLILEFGGAVPEIVHPSAKTVQREGNRIVVQFDKNVISAARLLSELSADYEIGDFRLEESNIEDIIREVYQHLPGSEQDGK